MQWLSLFIEEMCCPAEVALIRSELSSKPGIGEMEFDVFSQRLNVQHDSAVLTPNGVIRFLAAINMTAHPWSDVREMADFQSRRQQWRTVLTWLSGLFFLAGILFHAIQYVPVEGPLGWVASETTVYTRVLYVVSLVLGFVFVLPSALRSVLRGRADMNLLMTVAVIGALVLNEWFEAAMVTFLFSLSLWLEQWSMKQVQTAMRGHLQQSPLIARCRQTGGGQSIEMPIEQVDVGSLVEVWAGELIPLDGQVVKGESHVNQASITGESFPVAKGVGDPVFAGTTNIDSTLQLETTSRVNDSTITRTMRLVAEAQSKKTAIQTTVERFAEVYTPAVMLISLSLMVVPSVVFHQPFDQWFHLALVVLVVACPCALVISTPVATTVALTRGIREGVLIRGGRFLESMANVDIVCFDKTGTLTYGRPQVESVWSVASSTRDEVLEVALALESKSNHPLASAIVEFAQQQGVVAETVTDLEVLHGVGIRGRLNGREVWVGNVHWATDLLDDPTELLRQFQLSEPTGLVVAIGIEDQLLGLLWLRDEMREESAKTIQDLEAAGVKNTRILSGDLAANVEFVRDSLGIEEAEGELLPEQKLQRIEEMTRQSTVAMVGDGVNDAPALMRADVGIAMGALGLDVVLQSADISLMNNDLRKLPWLIRFSRKVRLTVRLNIMFALLAKFAVLVLALSGFAHLWLAVLADTGATLIVVMNGMRLLGSRHD